MAIEFMVADALIQANSVYRFDQIIRDPKSYLRYLHDDLLDIIRKSRKPELKASSQLLKRIDNRDLYKLVGSATVHKDWRREIKETDIANHQDMNLADGADKQLRPEDLKVIVYKLDWGNDEEYPLDKIKFHKQGTMSQPQEYSLPRHETIQQRPKQCCEFKLRVYVKDSSKEELAKQAFLNYANAN